MNLRLLTLLATFIAMDNISANAFEYKEVYLPEGVKTTTALKFNLNDVDRDWGIWGHNLNRIVGNKLPVEARAMIDGKRSDEQICFSSQHVYNKIAAYINENYGGAAASKTKAETQRFVIMPYDNDLACTCPICKARGNTTSNATPAVTALITKLCKAFPSHIFLTSYYQSTAHLPSKPLPSNAGVMISAIDWLMRSKPSTKEDNFKQIISQWQGVTDRIYVWDYINNFDDYATPFPCLEAFSQRISYYSKAGVKGLFLNGSGRDASAFSDMKTYVLASLMANPDADWRTLCREFYAKNYPVAGTTLSNYVIALEQSYAERGRAIQWYTGVRQSIKDYLDVDTFNQFYNQLQSEMQQAGNPEKPRLERLLQMLTLTRMEINRIQGKPQVENESAPNFTINEIGWQWTDYLRQYKSMTEAWQRNTNVNAQSPEVRLKLKAVTPLDEDYTDLRPLTDGVDALQGNYHCGWVLFTQGNVEMNLTNQRQNANATLRIQFMRSQRFRFSLPKLVEVYRDDKLVASAQPTAEIVTLAVGNQPMNAKLTLRIVPDGRKMAIGEISIE